VSKRLFAAGDPESQKLVPGCDLLLIATGKHPELGSEFVESHWFHVAWIRKLAELGEL
jgi:hypothetical protein